MGMGAVQAQLDWESSSHAGVNLERGWIVVGIGWGGDETGRIRVVRVGLGWSWD